MIFPSSNPLFTGRRVFPFVDRKESVERETFGDTEKERLESRTQLAVLVLEGGFFLLSRITE